MCADLEVGSLATEMYWLLKCISQPQNTCTCEHVDPIFKAIGFSSLLFLGGLYQLYPY